MKKSIIISVFVFAILGAVSCQTKNTENQTQNIENQNIIPFKIGKNYYINNTIKDKVPTQITTQQDFEKYFGMAAVMGKDGEPTTVDFSKEFVAVVDFGETQNSVNIEIKNLKKDQNTLILEYSVSVGKEQGFSTRPFQMLIIDKKYESEIKLSEQK